MLEDPDALARAVAATRLGEISRPAELTGADLDTPLGRALLYLHCNLVMDASEIPTATAGGSGVDSGEDASSDADDLWERLERETLGRDPRAGTYGRLLTARAQTDVLTDPLAELLDAMRHRAPAGEASSDRAASGSVLARLVREHNERSDRPKVTWSTSARVRVRTRNVLRRWAAAQTDPRLAWVNPLAPLLNLRAVATTFVDLYLRAIDDDEPSELTEADLDDLWARWFMPIVGPVSRTAGSTAPGSALTSWPSKSPTGSPRCAAPCAGSPSARDPLGASASFSGRPRSRVPSTVVFSTTLSTAPSTSR